MKAFYLAAATTMAFGFQAQAFNPTSCWVDQNSKILASTASKQREPIFLSDDGSLVVADPTRIASRTIKNGLDTVVVKSTDSHGKEVRRTFVIKRVAGQITSVKSDNDLEVQTNKQAIIQSLGGKVDLIKSQEATYTYDKDGNCAVDQQVISTQSKVGGKETQKVIYDKTFCDKVEPVMSEMGTAAMDKCSQFMAYSQKAYDVRNADLKKEHKTLNNLKGQNPGIADANGVLNLGYALQFCRNNDVGQPAIEQMDMFTLRVKNTYNDMPTPASTKSSKGSH